MPSISVPLVKVPQLFRKYGIAAQRETKACLPQVAKHAESIVTSATRNAPPASPNGGTGAVNYERYLKAWNAKVMTIAGMTGVFISNTRVYAPNIDYGRNPGRMPPISAIARWATKKFGIPYAEAKKIAWPIAKVIARRGLLPRGVLHGQNTTQDLSAAMETAVGAALDKAANKMVVP